MKRIFGGVAPAVGLGLLAGCASVPADYIYTREQLAVIFAGDTPARDYWTPTADEVARAKAALQAIAPRPRELQRHALTFTGYYYEGRKVIGIVGDKDWKRRGFPARLNVVYTDAFDRFGTNYIVDLDKISPSLSELRKEK